LEEPADSEPFALPNSSKLNSALQKLGDPSVLTSTEHQMGLLNAEYKWEAVIKLDIGIIDDLHACNRSTPSQQEYSRAAITQALYQCRQQKEMGTLVAGEGVESPGGWKRHFRPPRIQERANDWMVLWQENRDVEPSKEAIPVR